MLRMAETNESLLGHRLYLKRQYLQLIHHPGYTGRNHTEVLGTDQHACGLHEARQLTHSLMIPEVIVAMIEVVLMNTVEGSLVAVR